MTYKDVLLISESYIKNNSNIDWNLAGGYLLTAIKDAQFIELQSVIGSCLLSAIQSKIYNEEIDNPENVAYKDLLDDYIQNFLLYEVCNMVIVPISYKLSNSGLVQTGDEKMNVASNADINLIRTYYQERADEYKRRLQKYLVRHRADYPELKDDCDCETNLYSSNSSGIWLGGSRGKVVYKHCCGRD